MKYSGMGFQMMAVIGAAVWLGLKLDQWLAMKKYPVFTIIFTLLGVMGSLYSIIRSLIRDQ